MKYPIQQFEVLCNALRVMGKHFDLNSIHPSALHFKVYQQGSSGQTHNWLYIKENEVKIAHKLESLEGWTKLVDVPESFELYPSGCNDSHVETAVKRALKMQNAQALRLKGLI